MIHSHLRIVCTSGLATIPVAHAACAACAPAAERPVKVQIPSGQSNRVGIGRVTSNP